MIGWLLSEARIYRQLAEDRLSSPKEKIRIKILSESLNDIFDYIWGFLCPSLESELLGLVLFLWPKSQGRRSTTRLARRCECLGLNWGNVD